MASQKQGARGQGSRGATARSRNGRANGAGPANAARSGPSNSAGRGAPSQGSGASRGAGNAAKSPRPGASTNRGSAATATARPAAAGWLSRLPLGPLRGLTTQQLATLVLSLFGLGVSIYLTIAHFDTSVALLCSDKGFVNCAEVTTSPTSMVFGIFPVAVLGLAFYVFMTVINSPWAWRWQLGDGHGAHGAVAWIHARLPWIRLGSLVVGMCFVLYLIYAEIIDIGAICLWCTSVHVATFLLFTLIVFEAAFSWGRADSGRPR
jgi:uncharacterized membrane protein